MDDLIKIFKLQEEQVSTLLQSPETGMGYQIANVDQRWNSSTDDNQVIISNAELVFKFSNQYHVPIIFNPENIIDTQNQYYSIYKLNIFTNARFTMPSTSPTGASIYPPYTYFTRPGDEFYRLSAFQNDKRILLDGSVLKGTYATTPTDIKVTPSGLAAVARYALPNRLPASFLFKIIPPVNTPVYFGTITPNYGMCGGGVEVFFPSDLPKGSAKLFSTIPEK